jgi:hypothetical protein
MWTALISVWGPSAPIFSPSELREVSRVEQRIPTSGSQHIPSCSHYDSSGMYIIYKVRQQCLVHSQWKCSPGFPSRAGKSSEQEAGKLDQLKNTAKRWETLISAMSEACTQPGKTYPTPGIVNDKSKYYSLLAQGSLRDLITTESAFITLHIVRYWSKTLDSASPLPPHLAQLGTLYVHYTHVDRHTCTALIKNLCSRNVSDIIWE